MRPFMPGAMLLAVQSPRPHPPPRPDREEGMVTPNDGEGAPLRHRLRRIETARREEADRDHERDDAECDSPSPRSGGRGGGATTCRDLRAARAARGWRVR